MQGAVDRKTFLRRAVTGLVVPSSVAGLFAACTDAERALAPLGPNLSNGGNAGLGNGGYGPLVNDQQYVLLPEGFQARALGAIGDPMSDGTLTHVALDGMGAFAHGPDRIRLVRNHEDRNDVTTALAAKAYDPVAGGGTSTVEVGRNRELLGSWVSIAGTAVNCAGGPTPWGSWLTCEETVVGPSEGYEETHGWVFEVPAGANGPVDPIPYKAMGRFSHEAVAVDPFTGIVYETEDNGFPPGSGLFRFLPSQRGRLGSGGKLQMARVVGSPKLEIWRGSETGIAVGDSFPVDWVDIPVVDPGDANSEDDRLAALFLQGFDQGGVVFNRLEGCWFGEGSVFFHDTRGGLARRGHVWQYVPAEQEGQGGPGDRGLLRLVFESPGTGVLDSPDNITVSPRGGLVLCEDGSGEQWMRGLTRHGQIFDFAKNILNGAEFAGACFSPDGHTLFVNIQGSTSGSPTDPGVAGSGVTLAIWGPWAKGAL
jgi:secreted PhoX family phosphatase